MISVTLGNSRITQEKQHKEIGGLEDIGEGICVVYSIYE